MDEQFTILIADRNRHVRELLIRELLAEGYRVLPAVDGREVLRIIGGSESPDLLILDLDAPFMEGPSVIEKARNRVPPLPIIIHTFLVENRDMPAGRRDCELIEKSENLDRLKSAVKDLLLRFYPDRFKLFEGGTKRAEQPLS